MTTVFQSSVRREAKWKNSLAELVLLEGQGNLVQDGLTGTSKVEVTWFKLEAGPQQV